MNLQGKTAIVTGGSRGIGKGIALKLAELGANVVINYTSSLVTAEETAAEINKSGGSAIIFKANVRNADEVKELIQSTKEKFGSIDILINNAGITRDMLLMKMSEQDWDDVLDINLKGAFNCIKAVTRIMMKQRAGKIVNVSSVVGVMGNVGQANYAASKAGLIGLTKSVAKELAARNINCNAIAPGFINTEMTDKIPENIQKTYVNSIPFKRFGTPEDVANAVAFLVSDQSKYITGQVLHIDGGLVM